MAPKPSREIEPKQVGSFKKISPPRMPRRPAPHKPSVVEAMSAMIDAGRARQIAATLPDLMGVSAGLGDVTAQALQEFVVRAIEKQGGMSLEEAQFVFDVHRGTVQGLTKAYETITANPMLATAHDERGHAVAGQVLPPPVASPRRTKLFAALEAVNAAIDVTPPQK